MEISDAIAVIVIWLMMLSAGAVHDTIYVAPCTANPAVLSSRVADSLTVGLDDKQRHESIAGILD